MSDFGTKVKRLREQNNLSQDELAKKLGYKSRSSVNKIELGINDITLDKVEELAKIFSVSPAYLMGWEKEPKDTVLKQLRKDANLSKQDFINEYNKKYNASMNLETLRRIEDGHEKPNGETLINLANFFKVSTDFLLELANKTEKQFTLEEKAIISAYREHPELQHSVKLLLGIEKIGE